MKRLCLSVAAAVGLFVGGIGVSADEGQPDVKLTAEQQKEMSELQKEALEHKKTIINKYVEYGVFTEEKGQKIITHLEERYQKLEQNGFVPKWEHKHREHKE